MKMDNLALSHPTSDVINYQNSWPKPDFRWSDDNAKYISLVPDYISKFVSPLKGQDLPDHFKLT